MEDNIQKMEEESIFVEYFGDYPLIRVLDFLILSRDMDYSMSEIAKNSGVGWTAFSDIWPHMVKKEIVVPTRKIGNAKLFKLNTKNMWVKELIRMDKVITKLETEKFISGISKSEKTDGHIKSNLKSLQEKEIAA